MTIAVPWLLEREYALHRSLDPALPKDFRDWRNSHERAIRLMSMFRKRVVRMVIHPGELEQWAKQHGLRVDELTRRRFAEYLWEQERHSLSQSSFS